MTHIYFTVTNDLTYDQRMHRICHSLATNGYTVTLVGRVLPTSRPLQQSSFTQYRIRCFFKKSFLFYAEYNLRLFFYLLTKRMDGICAIDLDTIFPCLLISTLKKIPRIYDAHEYFTELKEVRTRKTIQKVWQGVESFCVPRFRWGYTVSEGLVLEFKKRYNSQFIAIRNMPLLRNFSEQKSDEKFLFYGGAVNEGRGFEYLIPAMKEIEYKLIIGGDGNFMNRLKSLIQQHGVTNKIELKGMLLPTDLYKLAQQATIGLGLAEPEGLNQFYALPNKFFDYLHAGLPQIAMKYPEYSRINNDYNVAFLLPSLSVEAIVQSINLLIKNEEELNRMNEACLKARLVFNWQEEEKKLLHFYAAIFE